MKSIRDMVRVERGEERRRAIARDTNNVARIDESMNPIKEYSPGDWGVLMKHGGTSPFAVLFPVQFSSNFDSMCPDIWLVYSYGGMRGLEVS